jgi:hypothetical protein
VCQCQNGGMCAESETGDLTCNCRQDFAGKLKIFLYFMNGEYAY